MTYEEIALLPRSTVSSGYVRVKYPGHPRSGKGRDKDWVLEHILVAEVALRKPLPKFAVVHHIDGDPANNKPENLVICPDQSYHKLLHRRQNALEACGNPDWRKCRFCGEHDDPKNMHVTDKNCYHRHCYNERRIRYG